MDEIDYLNQLKGMLMKPSNFKCVSLNREWTRSFPSLAGVYVFMHKSKLVYVGETGNLRERMKDLLDSRHHTIRRTIGKRFFIDIEGFVAATNKLRFPEHIELLVNKHICEELQIAYLPVSLGRKELEEQIMSEIEKGISLNQRGKRK